MHQNEKLHQHRFITWQLTSLNISKIITAPYRKKTYPYDDEKRALPDKTCLVRNPNTNCYFFDLGRLQCLQFSHESNVDKGT